MAETSANVHETADVADSARLASTAKVWHYAQIREGARIGENVVIGRGAYIGKAVDVGDNSKIQNYALVYEPAHLGSGVFIGPAVVLTNDQFPRAVNGDGTPKAAADWEPVGVTVLDGASIGAQSVCVAPVTIGTWALVGSGSTVLKDVPNFGLVVGSPARRIGWVGKAGHPLTEMGENLWVCPVTGEQYRQIDDNALIEVETS